ncbi:uncharacterized protein [Leptinotarsa decemlineata]|uniref:uncharacterized protein n=1 Tax=Leptinotarsa decemlineata TaxID=7539 RepID=UPI003D30B1DA
MSLLWESLFVIFMAQDWRYFKENITLFLTGQMIVLFNYIDLFLSHWKRALDLWDWIEETSLPWNAAGEDILKKITLEIRMLKRNMTLLMIGVIIANVTLFPYPQICEPFHTMGEKYFERWIVIIDIMTFIILAMSGYGTSCLSFKVAYAFTHTKFQYYLLNGILKNLSDDTRKGLDDEEYQMITYQKLVQLVEVHQNTKKIFGLIVKYFSWIMHPAYYIVNSVAMVCVIYLYMLKISSGESFLQPRVLITQVMFGYALFVTVNHGQRLSDETDIFFHNVYACPWYIWNKRNNQLIFLLMTNALQPLKLTSYSSVNMDYSATVKIGKISWSLMAVLKSLNEKYR